MKARLVGVYLLCGKFLRSFGQAAGSTWFSNIVITLSIVVAVWVYRNQAALQRRTSAYQSWDNLAGIAIEHDDLAEGKIKYGNGATQAERKYIWYMERLLIAGEQIVLAEPHSDQWKSALVPEIEKHTSYLYNPRFQGKLEIPTSVKNSTYCTYVPPFRQIIRDGIKTKLGGNSKGRVLAYETRLERYENLCDYSN